MARALHVLAHESFHLAGVRDEVEADCFASQRVAFAARELGAEYRTPYCFDRGPLDLDPASSVWP